MINRLFLILKKSPFARAVLIGLSLFLIVAIFILAIYQNFGSLLAKSTPLPVNLHSSKQANYSQDPGYMQIQPMKLQLVIDAIWDQNPNAQELSVRLTAVNENFIEKVSSITPQPTTDTTSPTTDASSSTDPAITSTLATTGSPTSTTLEPTKTSGLPTNTNIPSAPTNTTSPPDTEVPSTNTAVPPTNTAVPPTNTAVPPTNTSVPPTNTSVPPTNTSVPPTNTSIPPTSTSSPCNDLSISYFGRTSNRIGWRLNNSDNTVFVISSVEISWPPTNEELEKISLHGDTFWTGSKSPPSTTISSGWIGGTARRKIYPFQNAILRFFFDDTAHSSPYSITVDFTNGCSKSTSR